MEEHINLICIVRLQTSRMSASTSQTAAADSLAYVHQQLQDTQQHAAIIEQQLDAARVEIADLKMTVLRKSIFNFKRKNDFCSTASTIIA